MVRAPIAFAVLIALSACAPRGAIGALDTGATSNEPAASHIAQPSASVTPIAHEAGGINGGGGGTLPSKPIAIEDVRLIIQEGKANLLTLVNELSYSYDLGHRDAVDELLWGGKQTLKDVLLSSDIEINDNGPCKDATGKDVDGSMYASKPNAICISAARIAPKLVSETAKKEILALVMHELSHKVGLDEKAAVLIQQRFAYELSDELMNSVRALEFLKQADQSGEAFSSLCITDHKTMSDVEMKKHLDSLTEAAGDFEAHLSRTPRYLLDRPENDYFWYLAQRLGHVAMFVTSLHNSVARTEIDKKFGTKKSISFADAATDATADHGKLENMYAALPITRLQTLDEAKLELNELKHRFIQYTGIASELKDFGQATKVTTPRTTTNPFDLFVGDYVVTASQCTNDKPENLDSIQIKMFASDKDGPHLTSAGSGYSGDMGGLYDGAYVHMPGYVTVTGNATSATRTVDSGDRWGSNIMQGYMRDERKIERTAKGYAFTRSWISRKFAARGFADNVGSCTYELRKPN